MARSLARLALEAVAEAPTGGNVPADPLVENPEYAKCPKNPQVATDGGVACVQDTWAHRHWNVDARGWVKGRGWWIADMAHWVRVWSVYKKNGAVVGGV